VITLALDSDPGSSWLFPRSNTKSHREGGFLYLAGGEGLEPPLAESESAVLPLDDPPVIARVFGQTVLLPQIENLT
jgi:hypothetical protein